MDRVFIFLILFIPFCLGFIIGIVQGWYQGFNAHKKIIDIVFSDESAISKALKQLTEKEECKCKNS